MMVMWFFRFFVFNVQESPKYLMGRGRDEEAVASAHRVAAINGKSSNLTVAHLKEAEILVGGSNQDGAKMDTSAKAVAMRKLRRQPRKTSVCDTAAGGLDEYLDRILG